MNNERLDELEKPELIAEVRRLKALLITDTKVWSEACNQLKAIAVARELDTQGVERERDKYREAVADMYRTISAIAHTCALANDPECYNSRHYMSYREMHELVLEDLKKYKTLLGGEE